MSFHRNLRFFYIKGLLALLILFSIVTCISAQEEKIRNDNAHEGRQKIRGEAGEMKLTTQQSDLLKKIREKYEWKREDIVYKMKEKKIEMVRLLREDTPDRKQIEKKLEEVAKLEGERQKLFLDEYFEVRTVLSPEQVKIFTRKTVRALMRD